MDFILESTRQTTTTPTMEATRPTRRDDRMDDTRDGVVRAIPRVSRRGRRRCGRDGRVVFVRRILSLVLSASSATFAHAGRALRQSGAGLGSGGWMVHLLREHPSMQCTQIPGKPVIIGGDGGGVGKPLEEFLRDSQAVTFGPVDAEGNSRAERASGLDDLIVDIMAWAKRPLYEPGDMPADMQSDVAKHLCDMFARQEKWLHPDLTTNSLTKTSENAGRWGWKDPLAMYLLPIWRDVYGSSVTYVHLVRDPRTLPIGGLHAKERDLQKAYFGRDRWNELTSKFEDEWKHLSEHNSLKGIAKDDVVDLLRTTAFWTSINFEICGLFEGPLKEYAMCLRAEDLVQPDMDHFRRQNGVKLEKYVAAQKPIQRLTQLLRLPPSVSNTLGSHDHVMKNLKRFTILRKKFDYHPNSPIVDVQTRIAGKTLELLGYSTDADVFVPHHPSSDVDHSHRLTPTGEHMHEEHRYTDESTTDDDDDDGENWSLPDDLGDHTDHVLGVQLKRTDRLARAAAEQSVPETDQHRAVKAQLAEARRKSFVLENTKIGGKSLKDVIDHL